MAVQVKGYTRNQDEVQQVQREWGQPSPGFPDAKVSWKDISGALYRAGFITILARYKPREANEFAASKRFFQQGPDIQFAWRGRKEQHPPGLSPARLRGEPQPGAHRSSRTGLPAEVLHVRQDFQAQPGLGCLR